MSYVETILTAGERVLHKGRLHWIIYMRALALMLGGISLIANAAAHPRSPYEGDPQGALGLTLLIFALVAWPAAWIRRRTTEIAITNHRVIVKRGLIRRSTMEMNMGQIESVGIDQSIVGRLLD